MTEKPTPLLHGDLAVVAQAAEQFPQLDAEALRVYLTMRRVMSRADRAADVHFGRYGVSYGRFLILINLFKSEGHLLTPAALSERCGVTRATITGTIDTLERDGMVAREADPDDKRSVLVRLSIAGRRFLDSMLPDHFERVTKVLRHLSPDERLVFEQLLNKVFAGLDALEDPTPPAC